VFATLITLFLKVTNILVCYGSVDTAGIVFVLPKSRVSFPSCNFTVHRLEILWSLSFQTMIGICVFSNVNRPSFEKKAEKLILGKLPTK